MEPPGNDRHTHAVGAERIGWFPSDVVTSSSVAYTVDASQSSTCCRKFQGETRLVLSDGEEEAQHYHASVGGARLCVRLKKLEDRFLGPVAKLSGELSIKEAR